MRDVASLMNRARSLALSLLGKTLQTLTEFELQASNTASHLNPNDKHNSNVPSGPRRSDGKEMADLGQNAAKHSPTCYEGQKGKKTILK